MSALDLDAYFNRIGWTGGTETTLQTVAGILRAHMSNIPFENLDVLLGRPIRLDIGSIQHKLVFARRGGYCFEHSTLFAAALESIGFQPVRHSARVILYVPRTESARGHMFLALACGPDRFVLDPGFGGLAPETPVPLTDGPNSPDVSHWMSQNNGLWTLHTRTHEGVLNLWVTTLEPDNPVDFEVANHYIATHPVSPFVNRLFLRAITPEGRITVMNRDLTVISRGQVHKSEIQDRAELRSILREHFGFDLPEVERMRVPSIPEWE